MHTDKRRGIAVVPLVAGAHGGDANRPARWRPEEAGR